MATEREENATSPCDLADTSPQRLRCWIEVSTPLAGPVTR
jgi:hypothetical protein